MWQISEEESINYLNSACNLKQEVKISETVRKINWWNLNFKLILPRTLGLKCLTFQKMLSIFFSNDSIQNYDAVLSITSKTSTVLMEEGETCTYWAVISTCCISMAVLANFPYLTILQVYSDANSRVFPLTTVLSAALCLCRWSHNLTLLIYPSIFLTADFWCSFVYSLEHAAKASACHRVCLNDFRKKPVHM